MRPSLVLLNTIALVNLLDRGCFAQFGGLPQCAEEAGLSALEATGCHIPDFQCICSNQTYIDSLEPAFRADCDPPDVTRAMQFASSLCSQAAHMTITFATSDSDPTTTPFSSSSTTLWTSSPMFPTSSLEPPAPSTTPSLSPTTSRDTRNNSNTMSGLTTSAPRNTSTTTVVSHGEGVLGIHFSYPVFLCIMVIQVLYW